MKNPKPHASGRSFHRPPASAPNSSQKPPNSSQKPLNSSQKPPNSSQKPPDASQKPPNSSHKPPNSSQKPLNSCQKPPNSSHKPPNSSQKPPNSSQKPPSSAPNSSFKPSSSGNPRPNPSKRGKSRWESPSKSKPPPFSSSPAILPQNQNPKTPPILPRPVAVGPTFSLPPPPHPYDFQNLDRRTIVLIDGTVRSYFALPPEEPVIDPFGPPGHGRPGLGIDPYTRRPGLQPHPLDEPSIGKRKYNGEEDELARQRILQYGNPNPNPNPNLSQLGDRDNLRVSKHARIDDRADSSNNNNNRRLLEVDKRGVRKSFLKFVRVFYENGDLKKKYMANGRNGPLPCLACTRASKEYRDAHELIIHSYNSSQNQEDQINHLGLHKALCVLMGWNYENAPDNNKSYQVLSPEKAQANRDDIILWPPTIIIHNTSFGRKNKDGRFEGFSNKDMDNILKDLGFPGGKARSIYSREGHMGITCVQFANTELGLNEATKLSHYFERQNHDRIGWIRVRPVKPSEDDDRNPNLVKKDEISGEKKRVLYGYMASVADLDVVDVDIKKRAGVKSKKDFDLLD